MHTWIKQNGKWCISSVKHISQEVKQPYVKWLLMYSVPRSENLRSCPSLFLYLKWGSKLHVYASVASPPLGIAFLFPPLTIKGRWTVSTLWQHPGWFSTDRGTFSGSDLVQNTMIWSLFQCKAQSGIVRVYWSGLLFITNRAACSFYLLTSPRRSVSPLLRDPAELHYSISPRLLGYISPRSDDHWVKKATHAIKKLPSFSCLHFFELQLINLLLVTASNSLPSLHATSKATVCLKLACSGIFGAVELVYPAAVANRHIRSTRPLD